MVFGAQAGRRLQAQFAARPKGVKSKYREDDDPLEVEDDYRPVNIHCDKRVFKSWETNGKVRGTKSSLKKLKMER